MAKAGSAGSAANAANKAASALKPIEEWAGSKGTRAHVLAAVMEASRWGAGRVMSEESYDSAVAAWLNAAVDGR